MTGTAPNELLQEVVDIVRHAPGRVNEPIGRDGRRPLHVAVLHGQLSLVNDLLKAGAHVNATTEAGVAPLHLAARHDLSDVLKALLRQGAKPNVASKLHQQTPLHIAVSHGHETAVMLLLSAGADANVCDKERRQPLHIAAGNGAVAIVRMLLLSGADVDAKAPAGWTALHLAVEKGWDDVIAMLLQNGANPNIYSDYGWTPLHVAADAGRIVGMQFLLRRGAKPGLLTLDDKDARALAVKNNHTAALPLLAEAEEKNSTRMSVSGSVADLCSISDAMSERIHMSAASSQLSFGSGSDAYSAYSRRVRHGRGPADGREVEFAGQPSRRGKSPLEQSGRLASIVDVPPMLSQKCPLCSNTCLQSTKVPAMLLCPLSNRLMTDPVVAQDGYTYERSALQAYICEGNTLSPMNGNRLPSLGFVPNNLVKVVAKKWQKFRQEHDEALANRAESTNRH